MRTLARVSFSAVFLFSLQVLAQQPAATLEPSGDQPPGDLHLLFFGLALTIAAIVLWIFATRYRRRIS